MVRGVPHMVVCVEDILVSGLSDEEHLANVEEVLKHVCRKLAYDKKRRSVRSWYRVSFTLDVKLIGLVIVRRRQN